MLTVSFLALLRLSGFVVGCEQPGDIVAVNHGAYGRKEGLVIGSSVDYAVRPLLLHPHYH